MQKMMALMSFLIIKSRPWLIFYYICFTIQISIMQKCICLKYSGNNIFFILNWFLYFYICIFCYSYYYKRKLFCLNFSRDDIIFISKHSLYIFIKQEKCSGRIKSFYSVFLLFPFWTVIFFIAWKNKINSWKSNLKNKNFCFSNISMRQNSNLGENRCFWYFLTLEEVVILNHFVAFDMCLAHVLCVFSTKFEKYLIL